MGAITRSLANALVNVDTGTQKLSSDGLDVDLTNLSGTNITSGTVANARLVNSGQFTIDGTTIALGGSASIVPYPTFTSVDVDLLLPSTQTTIVITGTNYQSGVIVEAENSSTGAIISADTVTRDSSTQLTVNFTLSTLGTYYIRIQNTDGLAVRSSTALLAVSNAPIWSTTAGSLGSVVQGESFTANLLAYDDDSTPVTGYTLVSGTIPTGLTLNGDSTIGSITGVESGSDTSETTYNFTIRATDNESQTTDRAFSITVTLPNISNAGQFN